MKYSEEDVLSALKEADSLVDGVLTWPEYKEMSGYPSPMTVNRRCGSWNEAKMKAGIEVTSQGSSIPAANEKYFENIDSKRKAYWLGLLLADGSISKNRKGTPRMKLSLKHEDSLFLQNFLDDIEAHTNLQRNGETTGVEITSKKIVEDLKKHGINSSKTETSTIPDINSKYYNSFLRGMIDGDGHVSKTRSRFSITAKSKGRLENLAKCIPFETTIYENSGAYKIMIGRKNNFLDLVKWLYPDLEDTEPALPRKHTETIEKYNSQVSEKQSKIQ